MYVFSRDGSNVLDTILLAPAYRPLTAGLFNLLSVPCCVVPSKKASRGVTRPHMTEEQPPAMEVEGAGGEGGALLYGDLDVPEDQVRQAEVG